MFFLTIGITFLTAWGLIHRIKVTHRWYRWQLIAFAWLYLLMEGSVKYNLQVAVLLIILMVSPKHPWRSLAGILLASLWAGWSRVNWIPVPAMLAVSLYLLEQSLSQKNWSLKKYLATPFLWAFSGVSSAFVTYQAMVHSVSHGKLATLENALSQELCRTQPILSVS